MILGGFGIVIIIREAASLLNVKIQVFVIEQKFWDVPFRERALPFTPLLLPVKVSLARLWSVWPDIKIKIAQFSPKVAKK